MKCSRCGTCCQETEMLLSQADIERLQSAGNDAAKFASLDRQGYARLRNKEGHCVFYDKANSGCRVYRYRPSGCRIYPVIYSEEEGIVLDDICPMRHTVSPSELERKGKRVVRLLRQIDREAKSTRLLHRHVKQP